MDNQRIGALIAATRKERGLTQKELGQRLHVSDRAVSKWERGLNLPDAALFEPLCRELGITITELLRGEREEPTIPALEQVVSDTVALAEKKEKAKKRYRRLAVLLAIVLVLAVKLVVEQHWLNYQNQRYFDQDTTMVSVGVHYRDAALSMDVSLLPGGVRVPRVNDDGITETALYVTKTPEQLKALNTPIFDLSREETFFFSVPNPKTEMELRIYCWREDQLGTDCSWEDGQAVDFSPCEVPEAFGLPDNSYTFRAEPNYLYAIVAYWGDGYFQEHCFLTVTA